MDADDLKNALFWVLVISVGVAFSGPMQQVFNPVRQAISNNVPWK